MNAILLLLLYSVSYCFAAIEDDEECWPPYQYPIIADLDVDSYCEKTSCWIDRYERSDLNRSGGEGQTVLLQLKRAYGVTCDKTNPMREKLIGNLICLSEIVKNIERECNVQRDPDHNKFCKKMFKSLECMYDTVLQRCGQDAKDAFEATYPNAELYGCSETNVSSNETNVN